MRAYVIVVCGVWVQITMNYSFSPVMELPCIDQENEGGSAFGFVVSSPIKPVAELPLLLPGFNPRQAAGMSFAEKINSWLGNVPWVQLGDDVWILDCYPGHASAHSYLDELKSAPDNQDIVEQQARQITRIVTHNYLHNGEQVARATSQCGSDAYSDDGYLYGYAEPEY